jgi:predicted signal transduction protein with EAL and GGDEF domain
VARRIRTRLGEDEILARLGGDEFAILQPAGEQPMRAVALAERILEAIPTPMTLEGVSLGVGTSIGIALYPSNAASIEDLSKKADLALYRAKADGRGIMRFFDSAMDRQLLERHRMETHLRDAIGKDQFHLHYQPLACLETGGIIGFEALLRWTHPQMGDVAPRDFVPLAEDVGLIAGMGEWVLRTACREAVGWKQPLKVAVNLSAAQFASSDIVGVTRNILRETGLDPKRLDLEITERLLARNPDDMLVKLRQLRALGVGIAMDDFGTGHASLSHFRIFPFDTVKIDQTFVRDLKSREAIAIVKSIIGLGKGLGLSIIAEGVETMEQMEVLLAEGCQQIQGYLVSPPRPIEHFETILVDRAGGRFLKKEFRHPGVAQQ